MYISPIFGEIIDRHGVKPDSQKLKVLRMPPPKMKKELHAFLGKIDYLSKFSPSTANICESLQLLPLSQTELTWNASYQKLFDKEKSIIKEDACMKFYEEIQPLYPRTDASGVRLGAAVLQTRSGTSCQRDKASDHSILRPTIFARKNLLGVERRYNNIERKALGILHGLKKFHYYCFVREVSIITDHKPLVAISMEDVTMLSQRIQ